jgi:hypothetical protein
VAGTTCRYGPNSSIRRLINLFDSRSSKKGCPAGRQDALCAISRRLLKGEAVGWQRGRSKVRGVPYASGRQCLRALPGTQLSRVTASTRHGDKSLSALAANYFSLAVFFANCAREVESSSASSACWAPANIFASAAFALPLVPLGA